MVMTFWAQWGLPRAVIAIGPAAYSCARHIMHAFDSECGTADAPRAD